MELTNLHRHALRGPILLFHIFCCYLLGWMSISNTPNKVLKYEIEGEKKCSIMAHYKTNKQSLQL